MKATILNNSMFDDGSFECFNFWIANEEGTYMIDASSDLIQHMRGQIEARMSEGHRHLVCRELVYGGVQVLEIQWG